MSRRPAIAALLTAIVAGCASTQPAITPVASVDLPRFMGDWYVIAHIPSRPERDAYDAVESYRLDADGRIRTTYTQRKGSFSAPVETMEPVGTVVEGTNNAVWGMQFVWPIKAEYVIAYVDADYTRTIVARSDRDYAWIMARTPTLPDEEYAALVACLADLGYDTAKLRMVPQSAATKER